MPSLPFEPSASRARASDEAYEYLGEGDDDDEGEWDTHVHHPPSVYVDNMKEKRVHSMDTASLRLSVSDSVIR